MEVENTPPPGTKKPGMNRVNGKLNVKFHTYSLNALGLSECGQFHPKAVEIHLKWYLLFENDSFISDRLAYHVKLRKNSENIKYSNFSLKPVVNAIEIEL